MTERIDVRMPANTGASFEVPAGQVLTVHGSTIVDLVVFDFHDLRHRFDQARTKANQNTIFVSEGHVLISKRNVDMMRIVEDTFAEGHHDLQYGMCNPDRWNWAQQQGIAASTYLRADGEEVAFPDHGCFENLYSAVADYPIDPIDIPSPINLFQNMEIDGSTGAMRHTRVRPSGEARVGLLALIDCLVAVSACPDLLVGGRDIRVTVEPSTLPAATQEVNDRDN